jgi:hypothetical protein
MYSFKAEHLDERSNVHDYGLVECDTMQYGREVIAFQGNMLPPSSGSETLVPTYHSMWHHVLEDSHCENLKSPLLDKNPNCPMLKTCLNISYNGR